MREREQYERPEWSRQLDPPDEVVERIVDRAYRSAERRRGRSVYVGAALVALTLLAGWLLRPGSVEPEPVVVVAPTITNRSGTLELILPPPRTTVIRQEARIFTRGDVIVAVAPGPEPWAAFLSMGRQP